MIYWTSSIIKKEKEKKDDLMNNVIIIFMYNGFILESFIHKMLFRK